MERERRRAELKAETKKYEIDMQNREINLERERIEISTATSRVRIVHAHFEDAMPHMGILKRGCPILEQGVLSFAPVKNLVQYLVKLSWRQAFYMTLAYSVFLHSLTSQDLVISHFFPRCH